MNWKLNTSTFFVSAFILLTVLAAIGKNERRKSSSIDDTPVGTLTAPIIDTPPPTPAPTPSPAPSTATPAPPPEPTLHYPIQDQGVNYDPSQGSGNPLDLKDPANIKKDVEYDPVTNQYILTENVGDQFYRDPTYMSFDDYLKYQDQKSQSQYWEQHSEENVLLDRKGTVPKVNVNSQLMDRLFGGSTVDIRPNGNIDLTFGANYQNIQNPTLTTQQRKQGGFNFDMNIQLNVVGKIGEKMKLTTNYNTASTFDFENQVKLEYSGFQDEIIKKIEAGNVSLPLTGTLITGGQSLFGIKTTLQFGRLTMTSVISQNKAQTQSITVQGGAQLQTFNIVTDQYDENRNFLLGQYFKERFNDASATIPIINSQVNITRIEVWVTNRTGATVGTRNIVAFTDLGETSPYNDAGKGILKNGTPGSPSGLPQNNSNSLYQYLTRSNGSLGTSSATIINVRSLNNVISTITTPPYNLQQVQDFENTYARELAPTEYTFQPQLGYILLNQTLNPDDVLAVAYQYTKDGKVYQVGEFAEDVTPNATQPNVLFLKLLKATSARPTLPIWNLMMKNVYSLGAYQINPQGFTLNIFYLDPGGGLRRYIPTPGLTGKPLLGLLGLDRLDNNLDPQPDGVFDFIPNITINPTNGKVIFPVLQPFGKDLAQQFKDAGIAPAIASQYVYQVLYDSTKTVALQFPQFDRYSLQGTYKSSVSSDISLGAFNVPQGSVKVTAGGQQLQENVDYTVDYSLGRVKIINQGILNSGVPINISFENNATFGLLTKTLIGTRMDYYINDNLKIGGTLLHLSERPYTTKLSVGDDPISNTIYGFDGNYHTNSGLLTKLIDKIPMLNTKEKSTISASGEVAQLIPGHSKVIGKDGVVYIDDFEGTESSYDLKFPFSAWALSSTPQNSLFPEATHIDSLDYGYRRAKLSWYSIDPLFTQSLSSTPKSITVAEQNDYYARQIIQTEIFPNQQTQTGVPNNLPTFDLNFEPGKRGPYNFATKGLGYDPANGGSILIPNPSQNWGGIMRAIDYNDFEAANIEYIEFWVLSPYLHGPPIGHVGDLYIDLGNISEDILKDSRLFYENGLDPTGGVTGENQTKWGYVPVQPAITHSFATDPASRIYQDVGYDGLSDNAGTAGNTEVAFDKPYLDQLAATYGATSNIYKLALADPANDDYKYYLDATYDGLNAGILDRYKKYNNPDGNSPISSATQSVSSAETNIPETEDLNGDNTLSENEEYFEYKVSLNPNNLVVGQNFVTDQISTPVYDATSKLIGTEVWYQVKIPIEQFTSNIGGIPDFKSIRFVRMYVTGFDTPGVKLRFAQLQFIRDQWRKYDFSLLTPGEYQPTDNNGATEFNVGSVSLNENSSRQPINYVLPPGVQREQQVGTVSTVLQNESSLQVQVCNLVDGDARAVYKDINLDMRTYKNLQMFTHCESVLGQKPLNYGDLDAFIRLGSDFVDNYYEYSIPLTVSANGNNDPNSVWPAANIFNIDLAQLTAIKLQRDKAGFSLVTPYVVNIGNGILITIVGNPDLGIAKTAMLGVRNPKKGSIGEVDNDDGQAKCAEIWFDEMSLSGFNEQGGYAAVARVDAKLADFASLSLAGNLHTAGFGGLEQKIAERYKDNFYQFSASGTFQLGKFLPKNVGLQLPMFIGINNSYSTPQYDPYSTDVLLKDELAQYTTTAQKDSVRSAAQTFTSIKSLNFTNVRKINTSKKAKLHFWSIENFNATYTFSRTLNHSPTISSDLLDKHHGELGYAFAGKSLFISPFSKLIGSNKWLKIIKDINLNLLPTNLSFKTAMDRQFGETNLRPIDQYDQVLPTYNKYFTWDRSYGFKFDITKSLNIDFSATTNTRIDEDTGRIDTKAKRDSIFRNIEEGGRTVHYHHNINASYTLPINKIPLFDWIQSTAKYTASYDWVALPEVLDTTFIDPVNKIGIKSIQQVVNPLGNTISNNRNIALSGDFNFRNFYNKWKFLKKYDTKTTTPAKTAVDTKKLPKGQKKNNKEPADKAPPLAFIIRPLLSLKKFTINYTQTNSTSLPGYLFKPSVLGQDLGQTAPGWDFITGYQPTNSWLDQKAAAGWITTDPDLNYQVIQNQSKNLTMKASLEPIKDFNFDINWMKTYVSNSTQYFKDTVGTNGVGAFFHLSPQQFGSYTISYISWKTSFVRPNSLGFSPLFNTFENNRLIISKRLQVQNPNSVGKQFTPVSDSFGLPQSYYSKFAYGYGPYSQDVLIPAFIAAYTGKDPNKVNIGNLFTGFPMPNFHLSYNGLSKLDAIKKYFTAFTISSGYSSTFSVSTYNSSLEFTGNTNAVVPIPNKLDSTSNNFVDYYNIPTINISEQFSPLIGIDATWRSGISTKFEYSKSRNLAMSFVNYQLAETKTSTVVTALGYKWKNAPIPFKIRGKKRRLKNELNMQCGVNYSYNVTTNYQLDQPVAQPTQGITTLAISPSVDYMVNSKLNIRFFFDKRFTIPATSASYPIRYTNAGITIRFTLAQ